MDYLIEYFASNNIEDFILPIGITAQESLREIDLNLVERIIAFYNQGAFLCKIKILSRQVNFRAYHDRFLYYNDYVWSEVPPDYVITLS